jgi:hypothetical protein
MKSFRIKFFVGIFAVLFILGFGYHYREDAGRFWRGLLNQLQPCQRPITYSIASIDSRFGLTKAELLNDIKKAENIWESPTNKQLFEYSPTGDLKFPRLTLILLWSMWDLLLMEQWMYLKTETT